MVHRNGSVVGLRETAVVHGYPQRAFTGMWRRRISSRLTEVIVED